MRIVLMASGTRGDVQPMLALALALKSAGHHVRLVAGSNFAQWIESRGLEAYPTVDVEALMRSELGINWVEGRGQFAQMRAMKALMNSANESSINDAIVGTEGAELIVSGFVMEPSMQAISEKRGVPLVSAALQPYRASRSGPASMLPVLSRRDSVLNRWSGQFAQRMMYSLTESTVKAIRHRLALAPHTARSYVRTAAAIPALLAISPQVTPQTDDTNSLTTGYWFLDEPFTPGSDLERFLAAGEPPVYVGFGSMPNSDPGRTVQMIADALARAGQRGLLARGWSGAALQDVPDHVFILDKAPHDWLFPRMKAVVHHGGAGTTAAGLRAGKPTLVVPHMADQPYWARRVHALGVGPKPLDRHDLSVDSLAQRLNVLTGEASIRDKASALGEAIRAERGIETAVQWLDDFISKNAGR